MFKFIAARICEKKNTKQMWLSTIKIGVTYFLGIICEIARARAVRSFSPHSTFNFIYKHIRRRDLKFFFIRFFVSAFNCFFFFQCTLWGQKSVRARAAKKQTKQIRESREKETNKKMSTFWILYVLLIFIMHSSRV